MSASPLASAIARLEGYGPSNNLPTLANNPGSLELGDLGYGTYSAANGQQITAFPTAEDGWTALENQLNKAVNGGSQFYGPDTTLTQFGNTYSGGNPAYGSNLASILGVSPDTTLSSVQSSSPSMQQLQDILNGNYRGKPGGFLSNWTDAFYSARLILLIIGLLLIGAALFSFKQTQTIIKTAAKVAA